MNNNLSLTVFFNGIDKLSGGLKNITGWSDKGKTALRNMQLNAKRLGDELASVRREIASGSGNMTALINRERELARETNRANLELAGQRQHLSNLRGIEASRARVNARADSLQAAGQSNMIGAGAIAAPLIMAAKGAMDFQSGMTDIALKADLGEAATAKLARNVMNMAIAARQLPSEMQKGMDTLTGFGISPDDAANMLGPIGKVATAYKANIDDLAAASYANFTSLKIASRDNARALEIMAAAGKEGAFEIKDMAQYFPSLTAQAQAFGQTGPRAVADLAAAAQIARKGTGDSESAARNLENLYAKINHGETIDKFEKKFGIDLPASLQRAYDKGKTPLEAIAEITNDAVGGDLSKISFLFGDMQAQKALRPLIQNMEEFRRIREKAFNANGTIEAAFARRTKDSASNWAALKAQGERLGVVLGSVLLPHLVAGTQWLGNMAEKVANWADANPQATSTIMSVIGALILMKGALGLGQFAIGGLLRPLATLWSWGARFRAWGGFTGALMRGAAIMQRVGPVFMRGAGIIRTAMMFVARGVMRAGLMMLANPVVLAIVAIIAVLGLAGYMIYKHWDKIKAAFFQGAAALSRAWTNIKAGFMAGLNFIVGLHAKFYHWGQNIISGLINGLWNKAAALKNAILNIGSSVKGWFTNLLGIRSPSRVFMAYGGHIADGLAIGMGRGEQRARRGAGKLAMAAAGGFALSAAPALAAPARGSTSAPAQAPVVNITINAAAGDNVEELAAKIMRIIKREMQTQRRTAYEDY